MVFIRRMKTILEESEENIGLHKKDEDHFGGVRREFWSS